VLVLYQLRCNLKRVVLQTIVLPDRS